ncbi:MAG TPA: glycosyltransferase family 1 protein [Aquifex aeolicus]|nr:glycosyltransferase family 1 protein [Aquifex aeolicus]
MNIGILSRWNATCGVSLHAEMIGREFLRHGHKITVFAPYLESANRWWHHKLIRQDEDFVVRCYEEISPEGEDGKLNTAKVLEYDIEILIVESYEKIPYASVEKLVKVLKDKGVPSIAIIHEGLYEEIRYSDMNIFEKVIVFDNRFIEEVLQRRVSIDKIEIIPYPCYPVNAGKREFAEDGVIRFFSFGRQPKEEYCPYVEGLKVLRKHFPKIQYRVIRAMDPLRINEGWVSQEERILDYEDIVDELHKADIHLLPKGNTKRVVVSSTLYQILGTLTITVVPDNRFFEKIPHGEEAPVIFYKDVEEFVNKLREVIRDEELRIKIKENARAFVEKNDVRVITEKFERLINSILLKNVH